MIQEVRLMTWNVNGLRAVLQRLKKRNLKEFLDELDADIICFQETKLTRSELDEDLVRPPGYDGFYSFCKVRNGYSGVVTFCKSEIPTVAAEEGLTGYWKTDDAVGHVGSAHQQLPAKVVNDLESEGRCVITDHQKFVLLNVYCPALVSSDRLEYKLGFHRLLQERVKRLQQANKRVIVVGDINIAHREIDHCAPSPYNGRLFSEHPCRQWMDGFVCDIHANQRDEEVKQVQEEREQVGQLVDTFRYFHPNQEKAYTCWNTVTGARQTNYGTRIDYILVDLKLMDDSVTACSIQSERLGSDHCPVVMTVIVQFDTVCATKTPAMCAKHFAEFTGKQQNIKSFLFQGTENSDSKNTENNKNESIWKSQNVTPMSKNKWQTNSSKSRKVANANQPSIKSFFSQPTTKPSISLEGKQHGNVKLTETHTSSNYDAINVDALVLEYASKRKAMEAGQREWQQVLSGRPPPTPLCHCQQPTVLRSVLKTNENWGRKFYVCTKPAGDKGNPDARCDFFQWADSYKRDQKKPKTR